MFWLRWEVFVLVSQAVWMLGEGGGGGGGWGVYQKQTHHIKRDLVRTVEVYVFAHIALYILLIMWLYR